MLSRRTKVLAILFLIATTHIFALVTGYYHGFVDGKMVEYNIRFREQRSLIQPMLNDNVAYNALEIQRFGDGNVLLIGNLTQTEIDTLRGNLVELFGSSRAKLALSKISEKSNRSDAM